MKIQRKLQRSFDNYYFVICDTVWPSSQPFKLIFKKVRELTMKVDKNLVGCLVSAKKATLASIKIDFVRFKVKKSQIEPKSKRNETDLSLN